VSPTPFAHLDWTEDGQPLSAEYGDVYFSRESGLEETRHVFLTHNALPERFAELAAGDRFCIAETGFGTSLNFLCAWELWEQTATPDARLHFVSTEKHPLAPADLQRALALWPELEPWARQLLAVYDDLAPGWQHFTLADGRVTLTLLVGDLLQTLPELDARVDAWFLDGFAPAKNPDMWTPELFAQMARLSAPGASVATFTSVGHVRRGLQTAGFAMRKVKGYGRKREMLAGVLESSKEPEWRAPWYARPSAISAPGRRALIIGAGLAGCATAASLARRGWQVTVIERHPSEAREASGNPQGILYCKLSPHATPLSRFVLTSYAYCLRTLHANLPQDGRAWAACGVLQISADEKELKRLRAIAELGFPPGVLRFVESAEAGELAGVSVPHAGLFFAGAGWVHPPALCRALIENPRIELLTNHQALQLRREAGGWQVLDANSERIAEGDVVVLCTAADTRRLEPGSHLPLKAIRGQVTHLPATPASQQLRTVLCAEGYVSPARAGEHHVGASFRFDRLDSQPSPEENLSNLELLDGLSPALAKSLNMDGLTPAALPARAALRCTTPDYLPVIGPLVDAEAFRARYAALRKDASKRPDDAAPWMEGLFVNAAHGSRGLITAPLSGELIAAWLEGEPLPLPRPVAEAVHPSRFLLRELIRGTSRG
jgi:tRNA 5-methylaminomethyl-2-thiouridine biosynthesis bifunctional protein